MTSDFAAILDSVVQAVKIPGDRQNPHRSERKMKYLAPALAQLAEKCGVAAVIVHARPVSARHSGVRIGRV